MSLLAIAAGALDSGKKLEGALLEHLNEAEAKAWDSLGKYKFQMFGYWAAIWVHLNRIGGFKRPNPWKDLVKLAREKAQN